MIFAAVRNALILESETRICSNHKARLHFSLWFRKSLISAANSLLILCFSVVMFIDSFQPLVRLGFRSLRVSAEREGFV